MVEVEVESKASKNMSIWSSSNKRIPHRDEYIEDLPLPHRLSLVQRSVSCFADSFKYLPAFPRNEYGEKTRKS